MSRKNQITANATCALRQLARGKFARVVFHLRGIGRALLPQ